MPWEDKIDGQAEAVVVKDKWHSFDGNMPHCTLPYKGTRYTLIYFTQRSHHKIDNESKTFLTKTVGFPFPPPSLQKPPYPKQLARLTAAVDAFSQWKGASKANAADAGGGAEGGSSNSSVGALPRTHTCTGSLKMKVTHMRMPGAPPKASPKADQGGDAEQARRM
jgi:hypothetical protein